MAENEYIRFDWAVVRMLRQKSNFTILEGLLTTLLGMEIKIKQVLESTDESITDRNNRVDLLAIDDSVMKYLSRCRIIPNMLISSV